MKGRDFKPLHPWYKGWNGTFEIVPNNSSYKITGTFEIRDDDILIIDELPLKKWTKDYKQFLETLLDEEVIEDMREYHSQNKVKFELLIPTIRRIA
jgi:DNA topoisomerase-2